MIIDQYSVAKVEAPTLQELAKVVEQLLDVGTPDDARVEVPGVLSGWVPLRAIRVVHPKSTKGEAAGE